VRKHLAIAIIALLMAPQMWAASPQYRLRNQVDLPEAQVLAFGPGWIDVRTVDNANRRIFGEGRRWNRLVKRRDLTGDIVDIYLVSGRFDNFHFRRRGELRSAATRIGSISENTAISESPVSSAPRQDRFLGEGAAITGLLPMVLDLIGCLSRSSPPTSRGFMSMPSRDEALKYIEEFLKVIAVTEVLDHYDPELHEAIQLVETARSLGGA